MGVFNCRHERLLFSLSTFLLMAIIIQIVEILVSRLRLLESGDKFTFLLLVCLLALSLRFFLTLDRRPLPPGPRGLPFVGFLPFLKGTDTYLQLASLAGKFGPIFRMQLGVKNYLVLADYQSIKMALKQECFSGRPITPFTDFFDGCGIVNTQGETWKRQRKFAQEMLRNFGVHLSQQRNRTHLEEILTFEVSSLLRGLREEKENEVDLRCHLATCTSNVITFLLMSVRFEKGDSKFRRLLHIMDEGFRLFSLIAPVNFIPALQFVPGVKKAHKKLMRNREEMFAFFRDVIETRKTNRKVENSDFVDVYLTEIEKSKIEGQKNQYNEAQMYQILADLITSGMETTRVTLQWFLLFVASNPDVKEKIKQELDFVVGKSRLPTINDLGSLPYTEAAIWETQRLANVISIAPPHETKTDTTLFDYFIPRGTIVLPLLWCVHKDESVWKDVDKFDPTRFITKDGALRRPQHFIPFGVGRRHCLGSVLARLELFLIAACVLHQFDVTLPDKKNINDMKPLATTTLNPPDHKLNLTCRYNNDLY